ncbi:hypothetical protein ACOJBM_05370 [Rhizobium beringeri]
MERDAATTAWKLDETVEQLQSAAEKTTEDARLYVIKGEERYLNAFRAVDAVERERERSVKRLVISNLTDQERTALQTVEADAEVLDAIEEQAVKDFAAGKQDVGRAAVFSPEHEEAQTDLMASVAHFTDLVDARGQEDLRSAKEKSDLWGSNSEIASGNHRARILERTLLRIEAAGCTSAPPDERRRPAIGQTGLHRRTAG